MNKEPLTDEETAALVILGMGEKLLPIGTWKKVLESLYEKGMAARETVPSGDENKMIVQYKIAYHGSLALKEIQEDGDGAGNA